MKKRRCVVQVCVLILFFTSYLQCKRDSCELFEAIDLEEIQPKSEKINIEVFFDASGSMAGFVDQVTSCYARTIPILESALMSAWPNANPIYYKFGTEIQSVERNQVPAAKNHTFYQERGLMATTHIEKVIDKAKAESFIIIMTDLFQNSGDVNLLIGSLNKKFLNEKDIAFGVLGIKSEFNGVIGDMGAGIPNFNYSTQDLKPGDFRPFYILMIGKYADIKHYYDTLLISGLDSIPGKNFIIFSSHMVERLASFERSKIMATAKIKEVLNIIRPGIPVYHVKQFLIQGDSRQSSFKAGIEISLLSHLLDLDVKNLVPNICAMKYENIIIDKKDKKKKNDKRFNECPLALRAFTVKDPAISGSQLKFTIDLAPRNLPGNGIYCFRIGLHPHQGAYSLPKWISDWDMDQKQLNRWVKHQIPLKGNTTLNLKNFLNNIWQIIYQRNKPKIARLYCYIKRDS